MRRGAIDITPGLLRFHRLVYFVIDSDRVGPAVSGISQSTVVVSSRRENTWTRKYPRVPGDALRFDDTAG